MEPLDDRMFWRGRVIMWIDAGGPKEAKSGRRKKGEKKRTWLGSCPKEKGEASRRARSKASALSGSCRNVTVEENGRAEGGVCGRHRETDCMAACLTHSIMMSSFVGNMKGKFRLKGSDAVRTGER